MEEKKTPTRDFKDTEYYEQYKKMINQYKNKVIVSILTQSWIDNEKKYTRWDVLKEVLKFINWEMSDFQELSSLNPNRDMMNKEELENIIKEQVENLGIRYD